MLNRKVSVRMLVLLLTGIFSLGGLVLLESQMVYAYTDINVDTVYSMITGGLYPNLVVLDVRTQSEYDSGHIYGAVWIPVTELETRIGELAGHENHEIIIYCWSGGRSATASGILDSHGFMKVYNMVGGISAWQSAGYPVWIATVHNVNTIFNYDTIQAAIDAPQTSDGHTIFVESGIYYEHVVVNKSVSIIGEDSKNTIIDGMGSGDVLFITAYNVQIHNFTIIHGGRYGIHFISDGNLISNNKIIFNEFDGIIGVSNGSTISGNNVSNNKHGIYLAHGENNSVYGNIIADNEGNGIVLWDEINCFVGCNLLSNSTWGTGIGLDELCYYNRIEGNTITMGNNSVGIDLFKADNNTIVENYVSNNYQAVNLGYADNNFIYHNNFVDNIKEGIFIYEAGPNALDDGYPSGGNYWSDYNGTDNFWGENQNLKGYDMIGDTPYVINEDNRDRYPLMIPWRESKPPVTEFPDLNGDGKIDMRDIAIPARHFGEEFEDP